MNAPSTCGQGLAANAGLPDRMARLAAATAAVLEAHLPMLDRSDPQSRAEHAVYVELIDAHRKAAQQLRDASQQMARARDLPMGRHVDDADVNLAMGRAFAEFVESETSLHAALDARLTDDRQMLDGMR